MFLKMFGYCILAVASSAVLVGCGSKQAKEEAAHDQGDHAHAEHDHGDHGHGDHGHEGPHGGHLIELGRSHEFHAELVENDQDESITIYILDGKMKEMPIEQAAVTLNLTVDGSGQSFQLAAVESQDAKASQFKASTKEPFEALHEHGATGKLNVTINGTSYTGKVEHEEHDHDHGDHNH